MKIMFTSLILAGALLATAIGNECTQDDDCTEEGFICNAGSCESIGNECTQDDDCTEEGFVCIDGICECGDGYVQSGNYSECIEVLPDYAINATDVTTVLLDSHGVSTALVFRCLVHTVDGYKYTIAWFVNDVLMKKSESLTTDTAENFTLIDEEIFNSYEVEFFLDMKVQCSASVCDYQENVLVAPVLSKPFYPFQIVSNEIELIRGRTATVSVNVNIQLCSNTSAECALDIQIVDLSETHTCGDSTIAMIGESGCGCSISGLSMSSTRSDGVVAKSTITTKNNNKYRLKTSYDLNVKAVWRDAGNPSYLWNGFLSDTAKVTVKDEFPWRGQSCYSHADPHFRTLDGRYYDIHLDEEFVMLRHTKVPIEIQTVVKPCKSKIPGGPHCSCAVTLRAGRDVYTINHCDGQHIAAFLSKKDHILTVETRHIMFYEIIFPTSMKVTVDVLYWYGYVLNIDIYSTPADFDSIEGLCGTFNDYTGDDFKMRNGLITQDPVKFGLSWVLKDTNKISEESLTLEKNYKNQSPWKKETQLCVCQDPNSSLGGAICSANEEYTCSSPIKHKENPFVANSRFRRDTAHINLDLDRRMSFKTQDSHKIDDRVKRSLDNVISLDTAREMCTNAFSNCSLSLIEGTPVDPIQNIEECALDTAVTGTLEWFSAHCQAFGHSLEEELEKDVEYTEQNPEIAVYISQAIDCSGCSGNGDCVNGTCHCYPGFGSDICLVDLSRIVEVTYIFGNGYCDISVDGSCQDFIVESDGFVPDFSALVYVKEASKEGVFKDIGMYTGETTYLSFNEGIVSISSSGDQPSTSADDTILAHQFGISVSNDGVSFGNPRYVTVYNSRCQEISHNNDSTVVILKNDTCFIDGTCYNEEDKSPSNDCLVCNPTISRYYWTEVNCEADDPPVTDDVVSVYVIVVIVVVSLLLVGAVAFIIMRALLYISKPVGPDPSAPKYLTHQTDEPRKGIYSIEDDNGKQDRFNRQPDVEKSQEWDRVHQYVME